MRLALFFVCDNYTRNKKREWIQNKRLRFRSLPPFTDCTDGLNGRGTRGGWKAKPVGKDWPAKCSKIGTAGPT